MRARLVASIAVVACVFATREARAQNVVSPVPQANAWAGTYSVNPFSQIAYGSIVAPAPFIVTASSEGTGARGFDAEFSASKEKDTHRGLSWFFVEGLGGFEDVDVLGTGKASLGLTGAGAGGVAGGAIGARALFFTLAFRGQMGFFSAMNLGQLGGELGLALPYGIVEPRIALGGGYALTSHVAGAAGSAIAIHGGYGRATAGMDIYPYRLISFGVLTSFDFLGLSRAAVAATTLAPLVTSGQLSADDAATLSSRGSGNAAAFELTGSIALHL